MNTKLGLWSGYSLVTGVILFVGALLMLGANEMSTGAKRVPLHQIEKEVQERDDPTPDPAYNDRLVWTTARFESAQSIGDEFIKEIPALALRRRVWMFQWNEELQADGTARYEGVWRIDRVPSEGFRIQEGHRNPPVSTSGFSRSVENSTFGQYDGKGILRQITGGLNLMQPIGIGKELLLDPRYEITDNRLLVRSPGSIGLNYRAGDLVIEYTALPQGDYSIIARQTMTTDSPPRFTFDQFTLASRKPVFVLYPGAFRASEMLRVADARYRDNLWMLRALGAFLMWTSLLSMVLPLRNRIKVSAGESNSNWKLLIVYTFVLSIVIDLIVIVGSNLLVDPGSRDFLR